MEGIRQKFFCPAPSFRMFIATITPCNGLKKLHFIVLYEKQMDAIKP